jgi:hypothetical protein
MSVGRGFGIPWGGEALVSDDPATSPGDLPYSFDFTDEPDGPLPGLWAFFRYGISGGVVSPQEELSPTYFKVEDGLGLWNYSRIPSAGDPYAERGIAASPIGVVTGRNSRVSVLFRSPPLLLDPLASSFSFEVIIGLRSDSTSVPYIGGGISASWTALSGWVNPLQVVVVRSTDSIPPTTLATATPFTVNEILDHWDVRDIHDFVVEVRERVVTASLDGVILSSVTASSSDDVGPVILARIFNVVGGVIVPVPALVGVQLSVQKDDTRLGPTPDILGEVSLDSSVLPTFSLPLQDLCDQGLFKRIGSRTFEACTDVDTNVLGDEKSWPTGSRVRALDKFVGQELSRVVIDLGYERAKRRAGL